MVIREKSMSIKDENRAVSSLDKKLEKETAANKKVNEIYYKYYIDITKN